MKFQFTELIDSAYVISARLGPDVGAANWLTTTELGKYVKLAGDSRYDLCVVGDQIEGRITAVEAASLDGYSFGSVMVGPPARFAAICDGLQGTPGTGTLSINDYVVCGTPVVKGTPLVTGAPARVCKATANGNTLNFKWRVVGLGSGGGAVGTLCHIDLVA